MARFFLLLAAVFLFSCTKEKNSPLLAGKWTIVESNAGTGYSFIKETYAPKTEITIDFKGNGDLVIMGPNPGKANSSLWNFNKYEILQDDRIRFYHTSGTQQQVAYFTSNSQLSLWYEWARCGYEEKFLRIK